MMRQPLLNFVVCWGARGALLCLGGCVDAYMPDVINAPNRYLVVDGFINGNGVTRLKLSRTENIATTTAPLVEAKATVFILDNAGGRYAVRESSAGFYQSDSLLLNPARQYQLRIATTGSGGATYESALVPLKVTPPIDQLAWARQGDDVTVRLSTHDAQQQSHYYHWNFSETWEFNSAFESKLEYRAGLIYPRTTPIYTCWRTEKNTLLKQGSSAQLSQDAITNYQLFSMSGHSERLKIRYSVLVSQYAQTAEEFAYYELLRKNTEAVGTVNDPLPTQLTGNVHRVDNASEPVLGFVGAHTTQYKRLFIGYSELKLPNSWVFDSPYSFCVLQEELVPDPNDKYPIFIPNTRVFISPENIPVDYLLDGNKNKSGYVGSSRDCVDCRARGTITKPSYW
jgi:hypothetical protein